MFVSESWHIAGAGRVLGQVRKHFVRRGGRDWQDPLATALGIAACRQGKRVRFYTAANLIHELSEARDERRLLRLQTQLMKQDLIVLDEVGFVPFSPQGSQLLFQFCSERYLRGSVIFTTNLEFPRWTEVFGDPQLTGALLDRITHQCHIVECHGDSPVASTGLPLSLQRKREGTACRDLFPQPKG